MLHIESFQVNMLQENCYVVSDETKECVIIDCGAFYPEERNAITQYIRKNELKPVHLLVTHGHLDHNFGNDTIYEEFGLKPEVAQGDEKLMKGLAHQAETFYQMQLDTKFPPIGHFFEEDEIIKFGSHEFKVIETPGHSNGSVTFYCEAEHVAFTGDTLFKSSIGRTDFPVAVCSESSTACAIWVCSLMKPRCFLVMAMLPALARNWRTILTWTDNFNQRIRN